jgi:DNA-binding PadR family transcriptional regulator
MSIQTRRSPLALAILSLLDEEPMHPYRMQQFIKQRGKDDVVNVRARASLYQTIERLLKSGLIAVQETARAENRPERTIYRITDAGRETAREWLRAMIATPAREFPEFPAALAHLPLLPPDEVLPLLERRLDGSMPSKPRSPIWRSGDVLARRSCREWCCSKGNTCLPDGAPRRRG